MNIKIFLLSSILLIISSYSFSQSNEIVGTSKIDDATVFFDRAQIFRTASVQLSKGKNEVKFKGISTYIESQSLKVGGTGDFTILSVRYEKDMTDVNKPSELETKLRQDRDKLYFEKEKLKLEFAIFKEQEAYLIENKKVTYEGNSLSPESYSAYQKIYYEEMKRIRENRFYIQRSMDSLDKVIRLIDAEIIKEISTLKQPDGIIIVSIKANKSLKAKLNMSYMVSNVGWYASYDLRVDDINEPVKLVYKANVFQNTGNDWENVNLTFSNATPSQNNSLPGMSSYTLFYNNYNRNSDNRNVNYNQQYTSYDPNIRQVSGYVRDAETNEGIPFANVYCAETKVGVSTDINGYYSLSLPTGSRTIRITYVGYNQAFINIANSRMDIRLGASATMLESVFVQADRDGGAMQTLSIGSRKDKVAKTVVASAPVENKTSVEFKVEIPYTIKTDNKAEVITIGEHNLNATYEYHIRPRQEQAAFLIARITDWEKYKLISGNANLYLESTFVGKTYLNTKYVQDTLDFSLGKDQSVFVSRKRISTYTKTKIVGSDRVDSRAWELQVRNAKAKAIPVVMIDQVPISSNKEIKVEDVVFDGGTYDETTGYIQYKFVLKPKATMKYTFSYKVSFPNNYFLQVE